MRDHYSFSGDQHRVLLHCVRAEHRTPAVALLYAVKHRHKTPEDAARGIRKALGRNTIDGNLWETAMAEAEAVVAQPGHWTVPESR
ncbi:hypothetical protein [Flexivirga caeni]|uniref:Tyrosine specific protein phosphatases domain-containing protein n=1 Tax=Flexivirga caeni TaxID=2294115 RepID=A0A3M9MFC6_9MICO|nr:hypothetical protein [Flexivirga caeni]RNI24251.1 hypothetical protein EFY87_04585 [Flexivirga caeni]